MAALRYAFRIPKYPILVETDGHTIGASSGVELQAMFEAAGFSKKDSYKIIDSGGEGWQLMSRMGLISPFSFPKTWTKLKAIEFFNNSLASAGYEERYVARSLSNKRLGQVIQEMMELSNSLQGFGADRGRRPRDVRPQ